MFLALSNALSGLYAQKAALDVISHNIANANTEGYSRQRVDLSSVAANTNPAFFSTSGPVGRGVNIDDISRLRDAFLESRGRGEHATSGYLDRLAQMFSTIETTFGEPSDDGLQAQLADFWSAWDDLASRPNDTAVRSQLIETASTLTNSFNRISTDLERLSNAYKTELQGKVTSFNNYASQLATLNTAIKATVASEKNPNDLYDQRDLLLMKMAELAPVTITNGEYGAVNVFINGAGVVRGGEQTNLVIDSSTATLRVRLDEDGSGTAGASERLVTLDSGDMGGLLQGINTEIPNLQNSLDGVANGLITSVNAQHALGIDGNGNAGAQFFDASLTGAANISVLAALQGNPSLIAAQSASASGSLDGENARLMAELSHASTGADVSYRTLINNLGVQSNAAQRRSVIQQNIKDQVDAERSNTSGVSLDEEMANLVQYQHAYDAAAKMISIVDQTLDSLINMVR